MAKVKIPESKFKVGDRVKIVKCLLSPRLEGSYATICHVFHEFLFKEKHIYKLDNLSKFKNLNPFFWFDEQDLEFASTKKINLNKKNDTFTNPYESYTPNKTIVSHEIIGNKTIVTLSDGSVGISKCNPEDKFDAYTGLKLATERAYNVNSEFMNPVTCGTITSLSIDGIEIAVKATPCETNEPKPKFEVGKKYIFDASSPLYSGDIIEIISIDNFLNRKKYNYKVIHKMLDTYRNCYFFMEDSRISKHCIPYKEPQVKEVKREAKKGEYIKLTRKDFSFNEIGDILKVDSVEKVTSVYAKNHPLRLKNALFVNGENHLWHYTSYDYVVLENYKPEEKKEPKPKLKFKNGDTVFVRNAANGCQGTSGYRGVVTNSEATNGLLKSCGLDTTNVRLTNGTIWRVNTDGLEFTKSTL